MPVPSTKYSVCCSCDFQVDWAPGEGAKARGPQVKAGEVPAADDTRRQRAVGLDPGCLASASAVVAA